jgi:hypothetical protein
MKLLILAAALSFCGCGDDGPDSLDMAPFTVPHNFAQINTAILQPLCAAFSACHSVRGARTAGMLDLNDASVDPFSQLVNIPATNKRAMMENKVRVKPCDPDNSLLWIKLNLPLSATNPNVGYGETMPKDNPHLPKEQLDAIRDWIARGALRDEPDDVTGDTCSPVDGG